MKKIILILFSSITLSTYAQKKDSTVTTDTLYYIVLKKAEFENLVNVIKQIDEKPSIVNKWLEENIYRKTQMVTPPNKEKTKK